jgi:hypothetical protein
LLSNRSATARSSVARRLRRIDGAPEHDDPVANVVASRSSKAACYPVKKALAVAADHGRAPATRSRRRG